MAKRIRTIDLMLLLRRLADLTAGGTTLHRSLFILRQQSREPLVKNLLQFVQEQLEEGHSLSQAFLYLGNQIPPLVTGLVRAGESRGNLESALDESAILLENEMETLQRIKTALAYPIFLLVLAFVVCIFLTIVVIPRFEFLFQDLGQTLPLPTRILISFSTRVSHHGWIYLSVFGAGLFLWHLTSRPRQFGFQSLLRKIPGISEVIRGNFIQRWAQMMGALLKGGFTVPDALDLAARTLPNLWGAAELSSAYQNLQQGHTLKSSLEYSGFFPPLVCELIGSGEESGSLEESFFRIAKSYKRETELQSKLFLSLLEPALIAGMGLVVGFVALAMLLPIFNMSAGLK